jgi:uncharacterized protein
MEESSLQERIGNWQQTYTGRQYFPLDPKPGDIDIIDIAHSLSHLCRFGGHCMEYYSVAEHSVRVSRLVNQMFKESYPDRRNQQRITALWGLLHDAAEAYLLDFLRPMKSQGILGGEYRRLESLNMQVICMQFKLPDKEPLIVTIADDVLLATERRDLMSRSSVPWQNLPEPLPQKIKPWPPQIAKKIFLENFHQLIQ